MPRLKRAVLHTGASKSSAGEAPVDDFSARLLPAALKSEQSASVPVSDLFPVVLADRTCVEPGCDLFHSLVWIIDGKEDPIRAEFEHDVQKRLRPKYARRRHEEVSPKVFGRCQLMRAMRTWTLMPQPVLQARQRERQSLPEVTQQDG